MPHSITHLAQYYSSDEGGKRLYIVSSDMVTTTLAGTHIGTLTNPTNSGRNIYVSRLYLASTTNCIIRTYRNGTVTGGTSVNPITRSGSTNPSMMTFKAGGSPALQVSGGTVSTARVVGAYQVDKFEENGTLVFAPGTSITWQCTPLVVGQATVTIIYWEV
jgi:hypothetical protein